MQSRPLGYGSDGRLLETAQGTTFSGKQQPVTQLVPAGHAQGATPVVPQAIDPAGQL